MSQTEPKVVYDYGRLLSEGDVRKSHYTQNAYRFGLGNYRIISMREVVAHNLFDSLPKFLLKFINDNGECVMMANLVDGGPCSIIIRALNSKNFCFYGVRSAPFYGLGMMSQGFKFGDWVVVVEGPLDRDALVHIHPNTLAMLSSSLSTAQVEVLSVLTNKVVLLYDNDKYGNMGMERDRKRLQKLGIDVRVLMHPQGVKDSGFMAECHFKGKLFEEEQLRIYYQSCIGMLNKEDANVKEETAS